MTRRTKDDSGHRHQCTRCRKTFKCYGVQWQNYDGEPEVVCTDYHEGQATTCPACDELAEAEQAQQAAERAAWQSRLQIIGGAVLFGFGCGLVALGAVVMGVAVAGAGGWMIWDAAHHGQE